MQANLELVGSSLGAAATFQEKAVARPNVTQQTYSAVPATVSWGQTCRILVAGGGTTNLSNDYKILQNVRLSFNVDIGPTSEDPVAGILGAQYNSLNILSAIESIELLVDEQSVYHLERGGLGTLALKYMNNVIKRASAINTKQYGIFGEMTGMRPNVDITGFGDQLFRAPKASPAASTEVEFSIPLDLLFDDFFNCVDARFLGREWQLVLNLVTMPSYMQNPDPKGAPIPGFLLSYSQRNANPDPAHHVDRRPFYKWTNIRLEFDQLSMPRNIFAGDERIHTNQMFYSHAVAVHPGNRYSIQLGQSFRVLTHIRHLYMWVQQAVQLPMQFTDGDLAPQFQGIIPLLSECTVNIYWNGERTFEGNTPNQLDNLMDRYNQAEFSAHKLLRIPLLGSVTTFPETSLAPCLERIYPAPIPISYPSHVHAFDYHSESIHSTVLWGPDNSCPTGHHVVVDFAQPFDINGTVWQHQLCLALEASSTVSLKIQGNGRVLVKRIHN